MLMIPYGRQKISDRDIQAVVDVLRSDFLTHGPVVPKFEQRICEYTGAIHGIAVNSGTSALHIACLALGLGIGDWLWTSPITFVASANCGLYCGAKVDFVDIDPVSWNLSVEYLKQKLKNAKQEKRLPKVLVVVHLCGFPCDMEEIHVLSQKYGFYIIEDACHAIGGKYQGRPVGSCRYSDITVFSFHPVKTITTGEGGMAVTNSCELAKKMDLARNHGITRNPKLMTREPDGPWYYQQIELGYNYRMTDLHAALGVSQLEHLDEFVEKRHAIADRYDQALSNLPVTLPQRSQGEHKYSGMHLYAIRIKSGEVGKTHYEIFNFLKKKGVGVNLHYIPIHAQPYFQRMGFNEGDFPESELYYKEAISLPLFPDLSRKDQQRVVSAVTAAVE